MTKTVMYMNFYSVKTVSSREVYRILVYPVLHMIMAGWGYAASSGDEELVASCRYHRQNLEFYFNSGNVMIRQGLVSIAVLFIAVKTALLYLKFFHMELVVQYVHDLPGSTINMPKV